MGSYCTAQGTMSNLLEDSMKKKKRIIYVCVCVCVCARVGAYVCFGLRISPAIWVGMISVSPDSCIFPYIEKH